MGDDRPLSEIARPAGIGASLFCSGLFYRYMVVNAGSERFVYVLIRWRARWRRSPHAVFVYYEREEGVGARAACQGIASECYRSRVCFGSGLVDNRCIKQVVVSVSSYRSLCSSSRRACMAIETARRTTRYVLVLVYLMLVFVCRTLMAQSDNVISLIPGRRG